MAQLIDGRSLAAAIRRALPLRIAKLPRRPGLSVMLVGHDPASELYVKLKGKAAQTAGIRFTLERFSQSVNQHELLGRLQAWNTDPEVDAMLIQLPLPRHLREQPIIEQLVPEKDVDGFHPINTARFLSGQRSDPPGLVEGILRLIAATGVPLGALTATIVARSSVFTDCLEHALRLHGAFPRTVPPNDTHRTATLEADVVVIAAGRPKLLVGDDLKPGAIVIDVGINALPDGSIVGDVDRQSVERVASWLTPVPGGVGPMTIAMLLENVVRIAERNEVL
ncbi:MAG: bifunctional 5,10-methylenetetrahydrofolate dehydrogenase/5,10-methenyltetrahydrofolate cyclohydrolase [Candidatus Kerfeldbacteria bacterium]|nr:bifunctional 5,10-methylenetetrahydrofolate dehydrogenase/5,10-methenyltetrahydrofolate cyclohydrolase [Candidatus Kerfeldbacteria bacterium]